jgi:hypothetical protein
MNKLLILTTDDWEGLFIDGKLATEGHSISLYEFCKILGIKVDFKEVDDEYMYEMGSFPQNLDEIPEDKIK